MARGASQTFESANRRTESGLAWFLAHQASPEGFLGYPVNSFSPASIGNGSRFSGGARGQTHWWLYAQDGL